MIMQRTSMIVGCSAIVFSSLYGVSAFAEQTTVQSVVVGKNEVHINVGGSVEGKAVSSFEMYDPYRLVVDIVDVDFADGWKKSSLISGNGVQNVTMETISSDDGNIVRVQVFLEKPMLHAVKNQGTSIQLMLSAKSEEEASGTDELLQALGGLDGLEDNNTDVPTITNGNLNQYASSAVADVGATADENSDDPLYQALSNIDAKPSTNAQTGAGTFVPSSKLSGPDSVPVGPVVTSLDFEQTDTESKIIIGTKDLVDYKVTRPRPDTLLVDVQNAFLPQSLSRILDTNRFYSPVTMVRAHRTSGGTRISISLKDGAEYTVSKSSNDYIVITVPVPASMQQAKMDSYQSSSTVSPGTPNTGISNAYQKEILIGDSGSTSNPQSVFGSGSGANDPSAMLGMSSGFMYDAGSASNQKYTGKKFSIDVVNADIHAVFRGISEVSGLNIISGDDVSGRITLRLVNVPWDQALAAILQAKGLGSQKFGNIIRVAPIETIKAEQQSAVEAKRAQEELTELQLLVLPLNYAQASELQEQVSQLLSSRGSLQVDTRGNQLIIKETEKRLAQIRELVRHLDKETPQVLIEARVVEANSNFTQMMGIQWGSELKANAGTGFSTGLFFPNSVGASGALTQTGAKTFYKAGQDTLLVDLGPAAANSGIAFSLGSIPGLIDLDARLSAMESDGHGKVVSEPRISTLDNKMARISQGARIPFLSTSSGGTQVQFIVAALEMEVTPHITSDNQVFLDLHITNNRPDFSNLVQGQPAIQIKEAQTNVLVANGDTTVIGGVFSTESAYSQDKVPGFHKLPVVGALFQNNSETMKRNEMIVFITPHIVTRTVAPN